MTLTQKELIRTRAKFLYYLDCLDTLEDILGGGRFAADKFTPAQFKQLRSHSPLENCARSARQGDVISVECLMSGQHARVTCPHWLAVLSCFPETLSPAQYSSLLPSVDSGQVTQLYRQQTRGQDWCESSLAVKWAGVTLDCDDGVLYRETGDTLRDYTGDRLTPGQVSTWYCYRARQCVTLTSLPDTGE